MYVFLLVKHLKVSFLSRESRFEKRFAGILPIFRVIQCCVNFGKFVYNLSSEWRWCKGLFISVFLTCFYLFIRTVTILSSGNGVSRLSQSKKVVQTRTVSFGDSCQVSVLCHMMCAKICYRDFSEEMLNYF